MRRETSSNNNAIGSASNPIILDASFIPKCTTESGKKAAWKILENVKQTKFNFYELESAVFLKHKENNVHGVEMRKRAKELKANLGLADAIRVYDHWAALPQKLWKIPLLFPGTLFFNPQNGGQYIIYLKRLPDRCLPNFIRIDGKIGWLKNSRLLRPARTKKRGG